jgi:hypothetical protein
MWRPNRSAAQRWNIVYLDGKDKTRTEGLNKEVGMQIGKPFYLRSKMMFGRVVSYNGSNPYLRLQRHRKGDLGQQFFFDEKSRTIKSMKVKTRGLSIVSRGRGRRAYMHQKVASRWWELHRFENNRLVNMKGKVLYVEGNKDKENAYISWDNKRNNQMSQEFELVYVADFKPEPVKGELNPAIGLIVERPFFVVSGLKDGKYLDILGRNMVIKTRNGRKTQMWWFDQKSMTIKNVQHKGWSWDIRGHGRQTNMQAWNTNSGWHQIFRYVANESAFENYTNKKRLDVSGGKDEEGRNVQVHGRNNTPAQKWKVVYVD